MALKLIVFDFDGTLIDSEPGILKAIQEAVNVLNLPEVAIDRWRQMIGLPLHVQLQTLLPPEHHDQIEVGIEAYRQAYRRVGPDFHAPFAGIPEILKRLVGQIPLAIASSKQRLSIINVLKSYQWIEYFDPIVSPTEVRHPKPHPESLIQILEYHRCLPDQALMIGDTHYDMEMAVAAGVPGWGVTWGVHRLEQLQQAGARQCFETPQALLEALDQTLKLA